jgi:hypothetical protein
VFAFAVSPRDVRSDTTGTPGPDAGQQRSSSTDAVKSIEASSRLARHDVDRLRRRRARRRRDARPDPSSAAARRVGPRRGGGKTDPPRARRTRPPHRQRRQGGGRPAPTRPEPPTPSPTNEAPRSYTMSRDLTPCLRRCGRSAPDVIWCPSMSVPIGVESVKTAPRRRIRYSASIPHSAAELHHSARRSIRASRRFIDPAAVRSEEASLSLRGTDRCRFTGLSEPTAGLEPATPSLRGFAPTSHRLALRRLSGLSFRIRLPLYSASIPHCRDLDAYPRMVSPAADGSDRRSARRNAPPGSRRRHRQRSEARTAACKAPAVGCGRRGEASRR